MPEGPEIRRAADKIEKQIGGKHLDDVWFAFPELAVQADSLIGQRVQAVDTWQGHANPFCRPSCAVFPQSALWHMEAT